MSSIQILGLVLVMVGGCLAGGCAAPIKWMRRFGYEHWALISNLVGLVVLPWGATLSLCPGVLAAYGSVSPALLLKANLFSLSWGIANVLAGLCLVRIGFSLSVGLLTGIGLPIGVLTPVLLRGSGVFAQAPALNSSGGRLIICGVAVMLAAVVLVTLAGFGRDAVLKRRSERSTGFAGGMIMAVVAGFLQVGLSFAFVYSQGPIVEALRAHGAGAAASNIGVWAITLPGGALVNLAFPAWLLTRRRTWAVFVGATHDVAWALVIGVSFFCFVVAMGQGMRWLGPLGASVGFGVLQAMQILASQTVGALSGEWQGVHGRPRTQMVVAVTLLLLAVVVLAVGNALA